ncbi:hypothetical protein OAB57_02600 [Bacteriovoracaceae bacterium]|nr:hypothetical protein [Bacteriovoracaceae bacterium]
MASVKWSVPSNIALIKYWGKSNGQIPNNPSLSLTLHKARTETIIEYSKKKENSQTIACELYFEGKKNLMFQERVTRFLSSIRSYFSFLDEQQLTIRTENTFPHSTGIASSASAFGSFALSLCTIEEKLLGRRSEDRNEIWWQKASEIARLGSGSAGRSVFGGVNVWGEHAQIKGSTAKWSTQLDSSALHRSMQNLNDAILLVDSKPKSVSSTAGHELMNGHPFANARYHKAHENLSLLWRAIRSGDKKEFIDLVESEALTLHGLMMSSMPPYLLIRSNTLKIIESIQKFRAKTGHFLCFTLDAGPNIHLIYGADAKRPVEDFIREELLCYCENGQWFQDYVGIGPVEG